MACLLLLLQRACLYLLYKAKLQNNVPAAQPAVSMVLSSCFTQHCTVVLHLQQLY